ncbi:SDR family NAD(P)-dependent oxidoreductase [Paenarthrobacter histidinolovorans]|uniref:SDR family NAD(P)-dependent oxidoreductase n=1 Tax=Paenarthrobacter histidinolovorans TaxID=43664 RepID=UPI0019C1DB51|nr:SDR family NAD(P)-dependent oxidoreductase [Paenarthrobacter histidinolovorans]GGJ40549.1 oxidoreductase [Paenarthrobacter histidinolovorans]
MSTTTMTRTALNIVVAGSTSAAGRAVVKSLARLGARIAAVDVNEAGVGALAKEYPEVTPYVCNLADPAEVTALAQTIRADIGPVDGLIHLVGGWRGGDGIPGQQDQDWDVLHTSVLTTLRNTSRAFYEDLESSDKGRLAIVSSVTASKPTAGGASYSAIKAASEAWVLGVADGFHQSQAGHKTAPVGQKSAAVVFVVKALVDDAMREAAPHRAFPGYTDVQELAEHVTALFDADAEGLNGTRQHLI